MYFLVYILPHFVAKIVTCSISYGLWPHVVGLNEQNKYHIISYHTKKLKNDDIWGMPAASHIFFPFPCESVMINKFKTAVLLAILIFLKQFFCKKVMG
jgi:hypothetical protein